MILFWLFWGVFPPVAMLATYCDDPGIAGIHAWPWLVYFPVLTVGLCLQWKAHAFLLVAYAKVLGAFRFGSVQLTLKLYLMMVLSLDVLAHADFGTTGIFVSRIWTTASCPQSQVEKIWA